MRRSPLSRLWSSGWSLGRIAAAWGGVAILLASMPSRPEAQSAEETSQRRLLPTAGIELVPDSVGVWAIDSKPVPANVAVHNLGDAMLDWSVRAHAFQSDGVDDRVTLADSSLFDKISSDATVTDVASREVSVFTKATSTASATDVISRELSVFGLPPDAISSDVVTRELSVFNKVTSTAGITDVVSRELSVFTQPSDAMASDVVTRELSVFNKLTSTAGIADVVSRELSVYAVPEPPIIPDAVSRELAVFTSPAQEAEIIDVISREFSGFLNPADPVSALDAMARELSLFNDPSAVTDPGSCTPGPIQFAWTAVTGADAYRLDVATAPADSAIVEALLVGNVTTWTYTGTLVEGTTYYARIAPSLDGGQSYENGGAWSNGIRADFTAPTANVPSVTIDRLVEVAVQCSGSDNIDLVSFDVEIDTTLSFSSPILQESVSEGEVLEFSGQAGGIYHVRARAIDCAGNIGQFSAVVSFSLGLPPDLIVSDLVAPTVGLTGQAFGLSYVVRNDSAGVATGGWIDRVFLSPDSLFGNGNDISLDPPLTFGGSLIPGATYARSPTYTLPTTAGSYWVQVATDRNDTLAEPGGENNNTRQTAVPIVVSLTPLPDLEVNAPIDAPSGTIQSGQPVTFEYEVTNWGQASTGSTIWRDTYFLVAPSERDAFLASGCLDGFRWLGDQLIAGHLEPAQPYGRQVTVGLPDDLAGTFYLGVRTDYRAGDCERCGTGRRCDLTEESESNNARLSNPFVITLADQPDLRVAASSIQVVGKAASGFPLQVAWTVTNSGTAPTDGGRWSDEFYLSRNVLSSVTTGDIRIASRTRDGALLLPDEEDAINAVGAIPFEYFGPCFVKIRTDAANQVSEAGGGETNNVTALEQVIDVTGSATFDIYPSAMDSDSIGVRDHLTHVSWSIDVAGLGTRPGFDRSWYDSIYVSTDSVWQAEDRAIAGVLRGTTLQNDGNYAVGAYTVSADVRLPANLNDGSYYLIVYADAGDQLFENPEDLQNHPNSRSARQSIVVETVPTDLTLDVNFDPARLFPETIYAGGRANIAWRVSNTGQIVTPVNAWRDQVYFSIDAVLQSDSDRLIADAGHFGAVEPGTRYQENRTVTIPLVASGDYHFIVQTDTRGEVLEIDEGDNTIVLPVHISTDRPDLVASDVTSVESAPAGTIISVSWRVANVGPIATDAAGWEDDVSLVDANQTAVSLGRASFSGALAPGAHYDRTRTFFVPLALEGAYAVRVTADRGSDLFESNEQNNSTNGAESIEITPAALADLRIASLQVPDILVAGQSVDAAWVVENVGLGIPSSHNRSDRAYLSRDQFFDPQFDLYLGSVMRESPEPGQLDSVTASFDLPLGPEGPYFLLVQADAGGVVPESDDSNNSIQSQLLEIVVPLPGDLRPTLPPLVGPAVAGRPFTVAWDTTNEGINSVNGRWSDEVYLSTDDVVSPDDALLGMVVRPVATIAPGSSVAISGTLRVPGVKTGAYFVLVRSDANNQIPETDENDNDVRSATALDVEVSLLAVGGSRVEPDVAVDENRYLRVDAPADSTLRVRLEGATGDWVQIYARVNEVPTQSDFDYAAHALGRGAQELIISREDAARDAAGGSEVTYYLLVRRARGAGLANLSISLNYESFAVTSVSPTSVGADHVTLAITGTRWTDLTSFLLRNRATAVEIDADAVLRFDSGHVRARFDLTAAGLGEYDLIARDPGSGDAVAGDRVTVESPSGLAGDVRLALGPTIRKGTTSRSVLSVRNRGNIDVDAALLLAAAAGDSATKLAFSDIADTARSAAIRLEIRQALVFHLAPDDEAEQSLEAFASTSFPDSVLAVGYNAALFAADGLRAYLAELCEELRIRVVEDPTSPGEVLALALNSASWSSSVDLGIEQFLEEVPPDYGTTLSLCDALRAITSRAFESTGLADASTLARLIIDPCCGDPCGCFPGSLPCELFCAYDPSAEACLDVNFAHGDVVCAGEGCREDWPVAAADDPNEKGGEEGFSSENWVGMTHPLTYRIYFENVATASAPASRVVIVDELEEDFDPGSFQPTGFKISGQWYAISARTPYYFRRLDLRSTRGVYVDVTGRVDVASNPPRIQWIFQTIDPITGRPPLDPQRGFLPANRQSPEGEAFVEFLLRPEQTAAAGSILENDSRIVFDHNEAISTNFVRYRIDKGVPYSLVKALPDSVQTTSFEVSWTSEDPGEESGLRSQSLYVSENGGPFALEAAGIVGNRYQFRGEPGAQYGFYTVAIDNAGNEERSKDQADAEVHVSNVLAVWPGDTDNDAIVTEEDVLSLGVYFGQIGPARSAVDRNWAEQFAEPWTQLGATYSDADGDGRVDQNDLLPIGLNFGLTRDAVPGARPARSGLAEPREGRNGEAASLPEPGEDGLSRLEIWGAPDDSSRAGIDGFSYFLAWSPEFFAFDSLAIAGPDGTGGVFRFQRLDADAGWLAVSVTRAESNYKWTADQPLATVVLRANDRGPRKASPGNGALAGHGWARLIRSAARVDDGIVPDALSLRAATTLPKIFLSLPPLPNPSATQFAIRFAIPDAREVDIAVYDVSGRRVLVPLRRTRLSAGWHQEDINVEALATGVYFYRVRAGLDERTAKVVVLR